MKIIQQLPPGVNITNDSFKPKRRDSTLAKTIKAKYPGQYDDMDDMDLERAITKKYPGQYDDFVEQDDANFKPPPTWKDRAHEAIKGAVLSTGEALASGSPAAYAQKKAFDTTMDSADPEFRKKYYSPTGVAKFGLEQAGIPVSNIQEDWDKGSYGALGVDLGVAALGAYGLHEAVGSPLSKLRRAPTGPKVTVLPNVGPPKLEAPTRFESGPHGVNDLFDPFKGSLPPIENLPKENTAPGTAIARINPAARLGETATPPPNAGPFGAGRPVPPVEPITPTPIDISQLKSAGSGTTVPKPPSLWDKFTEKYFGSTEPPVAKPTRRTEARPIEPDEPGYMGADFGITAAFDRLKQMIKEGIADPEELTHPTAKSWMQIVQEMDAQKLPDIKYKDILSTWGKTSLKKGETWRGRVLSGISSLETAKRSLDRTNAAKAATPTVESPVDTSVVEEPVKNLPAVKEPSSMSPMNARIEEEVKKYEANSKDMPGFRKPGDKKKVVIPEIGMTEQDVEDLRSIRRNRERENKIPSGGSFTESFEKTFPQYAGKFKRVTGYNEGAVSVDLTDGGHVITSRDSIKDVALPEGRDYHQPGMGYGDTVMNPNQFDKEGNFIPREPVKIPEGHPKGVPYMKPDEDGYYGFYIGMERRGRRYGSYDEARRDSLKYGDKGGVVSIKDGKVTQLTGKEENLDTIGEVTDERAKRDPNKWYVEGEIDGQIYPHPIDFSDKGRAESYAQELRRSPTYKGGEVRVVGPDTGGVDVLPKGYKIDEAKRVDTSVVKEPVRELPKLDVANRKDLTIEAQYDLADIENAGPEELQKLHDRWKQEESEMKSRGANASYETSMREAAAARLGIDKKPSVAKEPTLRTATVEQLNELYNKLAKASSQAETEGKIDKHHRIEGSLAQLEGEYIRRNEDIPPRGTHYAKGKEVDTSVVKDKVRDLPEVKKPDEWEVDSEHPIQKQYDTRKADPEKLKGFLDQVRGLTHDIGDINEQEFARDDKKIVKENRHATSWDDMNDFYNHLDELGRRRAEGSIETGGKTAPRPASVRPAVTKLLDDIRLAEEEGVSSSNIDDAVTPAIHKIREDVLMEMDPLTIMRNVAQTEDLHSKLPEGSKAKELLGLILEAADYRFDIMKETGANPYKREKKNQVDLPEFPDDDEPRFEATRDPYDPALGSNNGRSETFADLLKNADNDRLVSVKQQTKVELAKARSGIDKWENNRGQLGRAKRAVQLLQSKIDRIDEELYWRSVNKDEPSLEKKDSKLDYENEDDAARVKRLMPGLLDKLRQVRGTNKVSNPLDRLMDPKSLEPLQIDPDMPSEIAHKVRELNHYIDQEKNGRKVSPIEERRTNKLYDEIGEYYDSINNRNEPSAARSKSGGIVASMDIKAGIDNLTRDYSSPLPGIMVREGIQNVLDAIEGMGAKGIGKIKYDVNNKKLSVYDNGPGMDEEMLEHKLFTVFATGKQDVAGAAGGKGIGSASYIFGGKHFEIESIAVDRNDGKKYKITISGTPQQFQDENVGSDFEKEEVPFSTPTGTTFTTTLRDNDNKGWSIVSMVNNIMTHSRDKDGTITFDSGSRSHHTTPVKDIRPGKYPADQVQQQEFKKSDDDKLIGDFVFDDNEIKISIPKHDETKKHEGIDMRFLNNGLYQFDDYQPSGHVVPVKIPPNVLINIHPLVDEKHDNYPFINTREALKDKFKEKIDEFVKKNISAPAVDKQKNRTQELYDSMSEVPNLKSASGRKLVVYDPGNRLTPSEMTDFLNNEATVDMLGHYDELIDDILNAISRPEWSDKLEGVGLLLYPPYNGVHIPNPSTGKSTILINPFARMEMGMGPKDNAWKNTITNLHEVAHIGTEAGTNVDIDLTKFDMADTRNIKFLASLLEQIHQHGDVSYSNTGHGMDFAHRLGETYASFGAEKTFEAADRLERILTGGNPGSGYSPEVQELLQVYIDRAGRAETTEDLLTRTGVKQGNNGPTPEESIPPDSESDGAGTDSGQEVKKQLTPEELAKKFMPKDEKASAKAAKKLADSIEADKAKAAKKSGAEKLAMTGGETKTVKVTPEQEEVMKRRGYEVYGRDGRTVTFSRSKMQEGYEPKNVNPTVDEIIAEKRKKNPQVDPATFSDAVKALPERFRNSDIYKALYEPIGVSQLTRLKRMGKSGQDLMDMLLSERTEKNRLAGSHTVLTDQAIRDLTIPEQQEVYDILDGAQQLGEGSTEKVKQHAVRLRNSLDRLGETAIDSNVRMKDKTGQDVPFQMHDGPYAPHYYPEELFKNPNSLRTALLKSKKYSIKEVDAIVNNVTERGARYSPSQHTRDFDIPGYDRSLQAIKKYQNSMATAIVRAQKFGPLDVADSNSPIRNLIRNVKDPEVAEEIVNRYLDRTTGEDMKSQQAVANAIVKAEVSSKLSLFAITQMGDVAPLSGELGIRNVMNAIKTVLENPVESHDTAQRMGAHAVLKSELHHDVAAGNLLDKMYGGNATEKFWRTVGAMAGRVKVRELFAKAKKDPIHAKKLQLYLDSPVNEVLKQNELTEKQIDFGGARGVELSTGIPDKLTLSKAFLAKNPILRLPLLFKRFAFANFSNMFDAIKNEPTPSAKMAKALKILIAYQIAGEAVGDIKALIRGLVNGEITNTFTSRGDYIGTNSAIANRIMANYSQSMLFGIFGDVAESAFSRRSKLAGIAGGPVLSDAEEAWQASWAAAAGNYTPAAKAIAKRLPYIGSGLADRFNKPKKVADPMGGTGSLSGLGG